MRYSILLSIFSLFFIAACTQPEEPKYTPDISKIPSPKLTTIRFEQLISHTDSAQIPSLTQQLLSQHPKFASLYLNQIILPDRSGRPELTLNAFLQFPDTRPLLDTISKAFPNIDAQLADISLALQYRQYYFPNEPQYDTVYTFASLYNYGFGVYENYILVGLDYFLGENYRFYPMVPNLAPQYIRRTLTPPHLARGIAYALATDLVEKHSSRTGNKMIDYMLYEGKKFYLAQAFLPNTPDSIIFAFTTTQMNHCTQGERSLYDHLLKEQLFYSDKYTEFRKYVEIGPFNPETALYGNAGSWLGAQMVSQYINQERKTTKATDPQIIAKMLRETDPQAFFKRYKPKK